MTQKLKIAVYTICLNEEKFVDRFMDCLVGEADAVYVTDTGSTDDTVAKLRARGAIVDQIKLKPWRFDVARNISMQVVPEDYDVLVCIDLDEVLTPGWRRAVEDAWLGKNRVHGDTEPIDRLRYPYVWNTLADGKEGITFWYDKIHSRHGFRWVKPVHEVLEFYGDHAERQGYCDGFKLRHFPDPTKSRGSYLQLLALGCREQPNDDRNSHYYGRELMYYGKYDEAIAELKRHLSLPSATWEAERAASMRYIGKCYGHKKERDEAERWFLKAIAEAPGEREPRVDLGLSYYHQRRWEGALWSMTEALKIKERPMSYICEPEAWGALPHDIAGNAAWQLGLFAIALEHFQRAAELEPSDKRHQTNVLHARAKVESVNGKTDANPG